MVPSLEPERAAPLPERKGATASPCAEPGPDVSVVIPAHNEEGYVAAALASVAAQTWPLECLEAVVVDNGSTDGTAEAVRAFIAATPQLAVSLVTEPVSGVARAKNSGARAARGQWLLFLDADSRMAPDLAERVVARGRAGYAAGSIPIAADSEDLLDRAFFGLIEFGKELFHIHAQMLYCARELFLGLGGFDESLRLAEDQEFLARLQRSGVTLCRVAESRIATSTRRLHALPLRLGMLLMFARWAGANWGIGRRWRY